MRIGDVFLPRSGFVQQLVQLGRRFQCFAIRGYILAAPVNSEAHR